MQFLAAAFFLPLAAMAQDDTASILTLSTDNANCLDPAACRLPELCRSLAVDLHPSHADRNGDLLDIKCNTDAALENDDPLVYINVRYKQKGYAAHDVTRNTYRFRFAHDTMKARGLELVQLFNSVYFVDGEARSLVFNQRLSDCDAGRADFVLFGQSYCLINAVQDDDGEETCAAEITYDDTQCGCQLCGLYSWTPDCSSIDSRLAADCTVRWPNFHHQLARYYTDDGKGPKHELFANTSDDKPAVGAVLVWILVLVSLGIAGCFACKHCSRGKQYDTNKDIGAGPRYSDEDDSNTPGGEIHLT